MLPVFPGCQPARLVGKHTTTCEIIRCLSRSFFDKVAYACVVRTGFEPVRGHLLNAFLRTYAANRIASLRVYIPPPD